jgi:hypothetical protein
MSITELRNTKKKLAIISLLAEELKNEIPDLDVYGSEKKLLDFAYHDLETCLKAKNDNKNLTEIEKILNNKSEKEEVKSFLKIWTKKWLNKWRERVTLCHKPPQFSLNHIKAKKKATMIFKRMQNGQELKKLVVQRLINLGEVCMAELIAENLIIEEMVYRLRKNKGKCSSNKNFLDPLSIYQQVIPRVKNLAERKAPIIHLKLMKDI